jgi:hypothetical protein
MSNRESWLAAFATAAKPHIQSTIGGLGGDEESVIRLSCGFPPITKRSKSDAAIVPPAASDDFTAELFISPVIDDAYEVAKRVLPLLRLAHQGNWRNAAPAVAKPVTDLPAWAVEVIESLGNYPHAKIEITAAPKQSTRLVKVECLNTGHQYIARVSNSTLVQFGAPICPACLVPMERA